MNYLVRTTGYYLRTTTVIKVPMNPEIIHDIKSELRSTYYENVPRRPTKISENVKIISRQLEVHVGLCEFVGEFPSVTSVTPLNTNTKNAEGIPYRMGTEKCAVENGPLPLHKICEVLLKSKTLLDEIIQLYEKKAPEPVVFSLADTNRTWKREVGHGMPIDNTVYEKY